jgi:hypothetical protein
LFDFAQLTSAVPLPAVAITSTTTGGNWSNAATWVGGSVPVAGDDVIIANGATVTIDTDTPALGSLTIGQGRSGILQFDAISGKTVTVSGIVTIHSGGTFRSAPPTTAGTVKDNLLVVGVSLINNGTLDFCVDSSGAGIKFIGTSSGNSMFNCEGSAKTNLQETNGVILEMDNPGKTLLFYPGADFKVLSTTTKGFLTIVAGIFKLASGAIPFRNPVFSTTAYTIPETGGFELSNANAIVTGQNGTVTNQGKIIVSAGTYHVGTATDPSSLTSSDGSFAQSGGTVNIAGRFNVSGGNCNISGGTMNIANAGQVVAGEAAFHIAKDASLYMSGSPLITFARPNALNDLFIESGGAKYITGGTFQMGTAATPALSTFSINSEIPLHTVTVFNECTIRAINQSKGLIKNDVNGTVTDGETLALTAPESVTVVCNGTVPAACTSLQAFTDAGGKAVHNCTLVAASFKFVGQTQSGTTCPYTITRTYQVTDIFGSAGTAHHLIFVEDEVIVLTPEAVVEPTPEAVVEPAKEEVLKLKSAMAAIISTATGGNWNDVGSWVGGVVPGAGDDVTIASGALVTVNSVVVCKTLSFEDPGGGKLEILKDGHLTCTGNTNLIIKPNSEIKINEGYFKTGASIQNDGTFHLIDGTVDVGTIAGNELKTRTDGLFKIEGGTLNITGRLVNTAGEAYISGGIINLALLGQADSGTGTFHMSLETKLTITGGSIILHNNSTAGSVPIDIKIYSGSGAKVISGGTFDLGSASTLSNSIFRVDSPISFNNFRINSSNAAMNIVGNNLNVNNQLTMNGGNINTGSQSLILNGGSSTSLEYSSGTVNGNLQRNVSQAGTNYIFPVGNGTNLSTLQLNFASITTPGYVTASLTGTLPSGFLLDPTVTSQAFITSNTVGFTTVSGSYQLPAFNPSQKVGLYNGSWSYQPAVASVNFSGWTTLNDATFALADCTPPPAITGNLNVCAGQSTLLDNTDPPDATSPWVSATTTVATVDNNGLVTGVSAGTSVITFTNIAGCEQTATVTVNPLPTEPTAGNVTDCFDNNPHTGSASLVDGDEIVWYNAATAGSIVTAPTGTAVGTYTAYAAAKITATGCESANRTLVTVTINALPTAPTEGNVTACFDNNPYTGSASLVDGDEIVWYNAATAGSIVSAPTGTAVGTYTAYAAAKITATGCESANRTLVTVTINALPTVPTAGNVTACFDNNAHTGSASLVNGDEIVWYNAATAGSITTAPTGTAVGTYSAYAAAKITATGCESANRTLVTVTINALPTAPTAGNVTACFDNNPHTGSASLVDGDEIVWYNAATAGSIVSAPTGTAVGTYTAYAAAKITATGCESANRTLVTVTINALPTAPTEGNVTACFDNNPHTGSASLVDGDEIIWYNAATAGSIVTSPTGTAVGTYTAYAAAKITATGCESANRTLVTVTINSLPTEPTAGNVTVCFDNNPYTGSASLVDGDEIVWYNAATAGSITTAPTGTAVGTYSAYAAAKITATGCESANRTLVTVTINALPTPPTANNEAFCFNGTQHTASATPPANATIKWYRNETGNSVVSAPSGTNPGTYSEWAASVADGTLCESSSRTLVTLTIYALPAAPTAVNKTVCYNGNEHSAGATPPANTTVKWYAAQTGATLATAPTATAVGTYTAWAASVTNVKLCESAARTQVTLTINPLPEFTVTDPNPVCSNLVDLLETISNVVGVVNFTYWSDANATQQVGNNVGAGTYYIKGSYDVTGCYLIKQVTVGANQTPAITNTQTSYIICSGVPLSIPLTANMPNTTFSWEANTLTGTIVGVTDGSGNSINLNLTSSGTGGTVEYWVKPRSAAGCDGALFRILINVQTPPSIAPENQPTPLVRICTQSSFQIQTQATGSPAPTVYWQVRTGGGTWRDISTLPLTGDFRNFIFQGFNTNILSVYVPNMGGKPPVYEFQAVYTNDCATIVSNISKLVPNNGPNVDPVITQVSGCEGSVFYISAKATGDQGETISGCVEYLDGTTWRSIAASCVTATSGGNVTLTYTIYSVDFPDGTDFRVAFTGDCGSASTFTRTFQFEPIISTVNACENGPPVTFTPDAAIPNGTWSIVDNPTQSSNINPSTGVFTPTTPGCFIARYESGVCVDESHFIVFPAAPALNVSNSCNQGLSFTAVPDVTSGGLTFTAEYAVQSPNGTMSPWDSYAVATASINNAVGCWTIKARYKTANDCGDFPAGTISDALTCTETQVTAFVFPPPPSLSTAGNSCGAPFTLPFVAPPNDFSVQWKINTNDFETSPILPTDPGCYSIQARYINTVACETTPAGTNGGVACESNIVYSVIFPVPPTPEIDQEGCGEFTVVTPAPIPGFTLQHSYDDGNTWTTNNEQSQEECDGYLVRTRYILDIACGSTPAGPTAPASCNMSSAVAVKVDLTPPSITCRNPNPAPVCVNVGDTYVHSGSGWDFDANDACGDITATLTLTQDATIRTITTNTLNNIVFEVGVTEVKWTVSDGCYTNFCTFTVTVNPIPTCTIAGLNAVCSGSTNTYTSTVLPAGGTVTHLWTIGGDGTISGSNTDATVSVIASPCTDGTFTITDNITREGCTTSCSYPVTVEIPALPVMTAPGPITLACGLLPTNTSQLPYTNDLTDGCKISGTSNLSTYSSVPTTWGQEITETWTAKDNCGRDLVEVSRIITVIAGEPPTIDCSDLDITVLAEEKQNYALNVALSNPVINGSCVNPLIKWELVPPALFDEPPYYNPADLFGNGFYPSPKTFYLGESTITYTLTDINGIVLTDALGEPIRCSFTVTVESEPEISCPPSQILVDAATGECYATLDPEVPTLLSGGQPIIWTWTMYYPDATTQIATGGSTTTDADPFPSPIVPVFPHEYNFEVGTTTIVWTATNDAGSDVCTQTITVIDNQIPTFDTPGPFDFCVENLNSAMYNGAGNVDLNLDYEPNYPYPYPAGGDYYLFRIGSNVLDLDFSAINYTDNCCPVADGDSIRWEIDFDGTEPSVSGTGQPSGQTVDIKLWGDGVTFTDRVHTITYWITDCNGNESNPVSTIITIKPRPNVVKMN